MVDNRLMQPYKKQPKTHFVYVCIWNHSSDSNDPEPPYLNVLPCSVHHQLHLILKYTSQMLHNAFIWDIVTSWLFHLTMHLVTVLALFEWIYLYICIYHDTTLLYVIIPYRHLHPACTAKMYWKVDLTYKMGHLNFGTLVLTTSHLNTV